MTDVQKNQRLKEPSAPSKFDFPLFLRCLKSKKADPIIRYIRSFLKNFSAKQWTADEQSKLILDFRDFIFTRMQEFEPFSLMNSTEFENSKNGMEKLIMTKLFEKVYSPILNEPDDSHRKDLELDSELERNYEVFGDVNGDKLDVDTKLIKNGGNFIKVASEELNNINNFKTPRAKIICILNSCKILYQLIKTINENDNADEFLPLLIYTTLRSKTPHLYCNLLYIERFAFNKSSEVDYYLVSLNAAAEYIRNMSGEAI